jgi:glycosidase
MNTFCWHQPALNYGYAHPEPEQSWQLPVDHPDVMALKEEMRNVMRFWLDMGCDGFRCDMAGALVKNDDGSENTRYWRSVREFLDREYHGTFTIAEWSYPKHAIRGGFSSAGPGSLYRAVDLSPDAPDVVSEEKDPGSLLNRVKGFIRLRNSEPALAAYAEFVPVYAEKNEYPLAYVRANGKERLLVVLNPSARDETATFILDYKFRKPQLISGDGVLSVKDDTVTVNMKGITYVIFRMDEAK